MYRIILVLDENYGRRVIDLAQEAYVWLVQSEENDRWAALIWQRNPASEDPLLTGLSTFARMRCEPTDELVIRLLEMIDEHHGEFAHDPAWTRIDVVGASRSARVEEAARTYGVTECLTTPDGFCLIREPSPLQGGAPEGSM